MVTASICSLLSLHGGNHTNGSLFTKVWLLLTIHLHLSSIYLFNFSWLSIILCLFIFNTLSGYFSSFEVAFKYHIFHFISCPSICFPDSLPICNLIFLLCVSFYPSCTHRPCCKDLTASTVKHLSPMCIISLKAAGRRCIDKQQPCQTKVTRETASGFTVSNFSYRMKHSKQLQRCVCNN